MSGPTASVASLVGRTLGHYRILEKIGEGGVGEVYLARDEHLDCDVAIKVLRPGSLNDESARKRFHKEARALSRLSHPNIAMVHDFDAQQGMDFLVMEYIPGITLSEKVAAGPLPEKEVLRLGVQLAEGLSAAHEHGVVHRDLKPGNLRVTGDGRLKILDFGLAKLRRPVTDSATTESFNETQAMAGTLLYMTPEQMLGEEIDARTDIHAAGSVLYEMATGQCPFAEVERSQLIGAILRRPPRPPTTLNPRLSPELERIIWKCLEKEPENRYQSAKELAVDLRQLGVHRLPVAPAATRPSTRWKKTGMILAGLVLAALALVLGSNWDKWRERLPGHGVTPIRSLAVLPLANLSGDPQQEYFADGMTEALITDLAKTTELRVISRTSVMHYKGTQKPLPEIARELQVEAVVEGSVQRSGTRVRITALLIRAASEQHLWAQSYERDLQDILGLQNEVAHAITQQVEHRLNPKGQIRGRSSGPVNPEAYEAYLKGRYYWNKRTGEGYRKSIEYFQQAIEKDPSYAPSYAGLADAYNLSARYAFLTPREGFARGIAAAKRALEIDDSLAEAHTALAFAYWHYGLDWLGAQREFKRALELNPGDSTAQHWYAMYFAQIGRNEEAIEEIERARELDPLSLIVNTNVAWAYWFARQYDRAIAQFLKTLEIDPNFGLAHMRLGLAYEQKGMFAEAIAAFRKAMVLSPGTSEIIAALGHAYGVTGRRGEALQMLEELKKLSEQRYVSSYDIAVVYLGLGEKDQALAWLARAYEERSGWLGWLKVDPRLDPLRSDPRFQDLLRRMKFPS